MADFLMRDQAPLSTEQWASIDQIVTDVARRTLVARRFIPVFGPLGVGVQAVPADTFSGVDLGIVDLLGTGEGEAVISQARRLVTLPVIYKDFRLNWRDLESSRSFGQILDLGPAAAAPAMAARAEDSLIFQGSPDLGFEGLLNVTGRTTVPMGDWSVAGAGFEAAVAAVGALNDAGVVGPFALALSPKAYASLHRIFANSGVLEIEQIRKLMTAGVYQTPVLEEKEAVVVGSGPEYADIIIAQDLVTAFLQTENLNHYFRAMESLALRVKRPEAVCTFA